MASKLEEQMQEVYESVLKCLNSGDEEGIRFAGASAAVNLGMTEGRIVRDVAKLAATWGESFAEVAADYIVDGHTPPPFVNKLMREGAERYLAEIEEEESGYSQTFEHIVSYVAVLGGAINAPLRAEFHLAYERDRIRETRTPDQIEFDEQRQQELEETRRKWRS